MSIRWGIIGCGDVARKRVAEAIQVTEGCELTAVCRRNQQKLEEFATQFHVPKASTNAAELIKDPEIDALYIATPVFLHEQQTIDAAARGKHVLVEKPMAMNDAQCQRMMTACRDAGVQLAVAYYRRFYPVIERIEELLAQHAIGTVFSISAVTSTAFAMTDSDDGYWRVLPEQGGGGALIDIGSHRLNVFEHLLGPIEAVEAFQTTRAADYDAENVFLATLRFANGALGNLQCYFGTPHDPDELTLIGSEGSLRIAPLNGDTLEIRIGKDLRTETLPAPSNFCQPLVEDFVESIQQQREPRVSGREGASATRIIDLLYQSARQKS